MPDGSVSLVLLAGGVGKRMGVSSVLKDHVPLCSCTCAHSVCCVKAFTAVQAPIPKQYLEILGQPIATYSLQTFASMREIGEIVVVCEEEFK